MTAHSKLTFLPILIMMNCCLLVQPRHAAAQQNFPEIFDVLSSLKSTLSSIPNRDDTLTVGTINMADVVDNMLGSCFTFTIPTYSNGIASYANPDQPEAELDGIKVLTTLSQGGIILYPNKLHLNIRFKIINWDRAPNSSVSIQVGEGPAKKINQSEKKDEVVFEDIKEADPQLKIGFGGLKMRSSVNSRVINIGTQPLPGLLPFHIDLKNFDIGGFQIPIVPITIMYAPPVDGDKRNEAKLSRSTNLGVMSSITFSMQKSESLPFASSYEQTQQTQQNLNEMYNIMSKIPVPLIQAIATGIKTVSDGLGSTKAVETNTISEVDEHSFKLNYIHSEDEKVGAKLGGPGTGDQFIYLLNPTFIWYKRNNHLYLTLAGKAERVSVSAQQLKEALSRLRNKPAGTKDNILNIDAGSITELLKLDPFVAGGPSAELPAKRFKPVDGIIYHIGAQEMSQSFTIQTTAEDKEISTKTRMLVETDSKGMLATIGLGVDSDKVMQSIISQSNAHQQTDIETISNSFTFNGNGQEYYSVEVYYDVVFGTFAFRQLPPNGSTETISGKIDGAGNPGFAGSDIVMRAGNEIYITRADEQGNFKLPAPAKKNGFIKLSSGSVDKTILYKGKTIKNIVLKQG